uniref:Uncharacterized protein n=1 Tax=Avena sativa TaxID=4498 RepID=A0ACD5Y672_AVESA
MRGSGQLPLIRIFFIGYLVGRAQCGVEAQQMVIYRDGHANTSIDATMLKSASVEESKLHLKFCVRHFGCRLEGGYNGTCYCCVKQEEHCFETRDECNDYCPDCNPNCPPPSYN